MLYSSSVDDDVIIFMILIHLGGGFQFNISIVKTIGRSVKKPLIYLLFVARVTYVNDAGKRITTSFTISLSHKAVVRIKKKAVAIRCLHI